MKLAAPLLVHLRDAEVSAQAASGEGARISIDPLFVVLDNSVIRGRAAGADVPVDIVADSSDSLIESDAVTAPIEVDIAGSLARLPGRLFAAGAALAPTCGARYEGEVSSFIATGRGGTPPEPGGWLPSFDVRAPGGAD